MDLEVLGHRSRDFQPVGKERSWIKAGGALQVIQKPCTTYIYLYIECAHCFDFIRTGAGPIAGVVPAVRGRD